MKLEEGEKVLRRVDIIELESEHLTSKGSLILTDKQLIFNYRGEAEFLGMTIPEDMVRKAHGTFAPFSLPLYNIIDVTKPFLKNELILVVKQRGSEIGKQWGANLLHEVINKFREVRQPNILKSEIMRQVKNMRAQS